VRIYPRDVAWFVRPSTKKLAERTQPQGVRSTHHRRRVGDHRQEPPMTDANTSPKPDTTSDPEEVDPATGTDKENKPVENPSG
jgi:hypothetical protein